MPILTDIQGGDYIVDSRGGVFFVLRELTGSNSYVCKRYGTVIGVTHVLGNEIARRATPLEVIDFRMAEEQVRRELNAIRGLAEEASGA